MIKKVKRLDEQGASLVEVLGALVIFSMIVVMAGNLFVQNQKAIQYNVKLTDAEGIKYDIKEWLMNDSVRFDISQLNFICFVAHDSNLPSEKKRAQYLLLDDTGITYGPNGKSIYSEVPFMETNFNGTPRKVKRKVSYKDVELPASLASKAGSIGFYRDNPNYLVESLVVKIDPLAKMALQLQLNIYDCKNGDLLSSSTFRWLVDNSRQDNPEWEIPR